MDQTARLTDALKQILRAAGVSYGVLARGIGLSESSVKRLFSTRNFTLRRLEQICRFLEVDFLELARLARLDRDQAARQLTTEQEALLAAQPSLLTLFYLVLNGWQAGSIMERLQWSLAQLERGLDALERAGLVRRLRRGRIRPLTARGLQWQRRGPLRRRYEAEIKREFLSGDFRQAGETLVFETAELSTASIVTLQRKLAAVVREFDELAEADQSLPPAQRRGTGLLLAFRPWVFSLLAPPPRRSASAA